MAINIHFFRNNTLDKLDYEKVLEFFDELPNFEVFYTKASPISYLKYSS